MFMGLLTQAMQLQRLHGTSAELYAKRDGDLSSSFHAGAPGSSWATRELAIFAWLLVFCLMFL